MAAAAAYTLSQVRRLTVLPRGFIATLVELGIVEPDEGLRFSHQDLVVLRTAKMLRDADVPARRIIQALRNVKAHLASEGERESGVPEMALQAVPIEAQSTAVAGATASICNDEWGGLGRQGGHAGFPPTLSTHLASVRLRANGGAVEASAGPRRFDAVSGQLLLPLEDNEPGGLHAFAAAAEATARLAQAVQDDARDTAAAEAGYREALRLDAACCPAYVNLGALLSEQGRHGEALALYDDAMHWCEAHPLLHFNRAIALEDLHQPEAAVAAYQRCLQLDPALADAHFNLGVLLERLGDPQGALRHFSAFRRFAIP
jgi:tetratricopeptide (TPR) repeat protein